MLYMFLDYIFLLLFSQMFRFVNGSAVDIVGWASIVFPVRDGQHRVLTDIYILHCPATEQTRERAGSTNILAARSASSTPCCGCEIPQMSCSPRYHISLMARGTPRAHGWWGLEMPGAVMFPQFQHAKEDGTGEIGTTSSTAGPHRPDLWCLPFH